MNSKKQFAPSRPVNVLLALSFLLLTPISAYGDNRAEVSQLGNGVVVDTSAQRVFVMNPKAGIQAINAVTGHSVWKSVAADRPVSASGSVLLAQVESSKKGTLELAYLDTATGQLLDTLNVAMPDDVHARVTDSLDSRFAVQTIRGASAEELHWSHSFRRIQGARLSRDAAPAQKAEGFLAADFSKRTVKTMNRPAISKASADYRAPMPADAPGQRAMYSTDRQHLVTSSALDAEERSTSDSGARYQWHVYTSSGKKLQSFASTVSFAPFVVVQDQLLYLTPPRKYRSGDQVMIVPMSLVAVDLATGNPSYSVAVRDTRYRGPFPP